MKDTDPTDERIQEAVAFMQRPGVTVDDVVKSDFTTQVLALAALKVVRDTKALTEQHSIPHYEP